MCFLFILASPTQMNTSEEITFYLLLQFHALHFCVEFHGNPATNIWGAPTSLAKAQMSNATNELSQSSNEQCHPRAWRSSRAMVSWELGSRNSAQDAMVVDSQNPSVEVPTGITHESSQQWWLRSLHSLGRKDLLVMAKVPPRLGSREDLSVYRSDSWASSSGVLGDGQSPSLV
jgi:hypothetical protein